MKGKFDEKLAELAFGDLSPKEAERIEAQASMDPEAMRVLSTYRSMKGGMGDLMDIPEDQLSKDRLRNAILMQGLKPKPEKASPLGWLWMPATAFLLAAAVMLFNPQGSGGDPVVAVSEKDVPSNFVAIKPLTSFNFGTLSAGTASEEKEAPKSIVVAQSQQSEPPVRRKRIRNNEELAKVELKGFGLIASNHQAPRITITTVPDPEMSPETEASAPPTPIVIIEDNRDVSTGAYRAIEVGSSSNVLIGG